MRFSRSCASRMPRHAPRRGSSSNLRIHGTLRKVDYPPLTDAVLRPMLYEMLSEKQIERVEKPKDLISATRLPASRVSVATSSPRAPGLAAAFRRIPFQISTLAEVGAPDVFKQVCEYKSGLVLVTGPTGCGKSTTLAAMIDHINKTTNLHIITLEDPLEFVHEPKGCMISQREIGTHCDDFASGLRSSFARRPERGARRRNARLDTIQLAISAAETGHLVFATLHTSERTQDGGPHHRRVPTDRQSQVRTMLSESLRAVISQQLLPKADGKSRIAAYEILVATRVFEASSANRRHFKSHP